MKKVFTRIGRKTFCEVVNKKTGEVFTGVAKCSASDDFNHIVGEKIAFHRAMVKMHETTVKDIKFVKRDLVPILNELNREQEKAEYEARVNRNFVSQWIY